MKRLAMVALLAGFVGFALGNGFFYVASPFWIDRAVEEPPPPELAFEVLAQGSFRDADRLHRGRGTARLGRTAGGTAVLHFTGFRVTNGPALEVRLVEAEVGSTAEVAAARWLSLGPLKGNLGEQYYVLPPGLDLAAYRSVVVWCRQFGVLFAPATLVAAGPPPAA